MNNGDVSFTFIDRIEEIELNIKDERWQSALALSLTIPDICGAIAFPELIRIHRDGKVVLNKKGETSRDIGKQYVTWYNTYAAKYFKKRPDDEQPYLSGERCWQLRCEYLHQNKGFDNVKENPDTHFHLGINCGSTTCHLDEEEKDGEITHIRLDIKELCRRLCLAAREFYEENKDNEDFNLYNTPVIDFIKWKQNQK